MLGQIAIPDRLIRPMFIYSFIIIIFECNLFSKILNIEPKYIIHSNEIDLSKKSNIQLKLFDFISFYYFVLLRLILSRSIDGFSCCLISKPSIFHMEYHFVPIFPNTAISKCRHATAIRFKFIENSALFFSLSVYLLY